MAESKKTKTSAKKTKRKKTSRKKEPRYLEIKKQPSQEEKIKNRLLWLIVGGLGVILIFFSFWHLATNIVSKSRLESEINQEWEGFKKSFESEEALNPAEKEAFEKTKEKIISQLKENLNRAEWPWHHSEILGVGFQYPPEWQKIETTGKIIITSYKNNQPPEENFGRLTVELIETETNLSLENWLEENKINLQEYRQNEIAGRPAWEKTNQLNSQGFNQTGYLRAENKIFRLTAEADCRGELYQTIFEKIISSLEFSK